MNDLLDALHGDLQGHAPRYSVHDAEKVAARQDALNHNAEVQRLADTYGVNPSGMNRQQFFGALAEHLSLEKFAEEMRSIEEARAGEFTDFVSDAREWVEEHGGNGIPTSFMVSKARGPSWSWRMRIDRRTVLDERDKALRASRNQFLPEDLRNLAKSSADKADVVLGMQDALAAKLGSRWAAEQAMDSVPDPRDEPEGPNLVDLQKLGFAPLT